MLKQYLLAFTCMLAACNLYGQAKWDRQISMRSCSISIKADLFTATTFIEMEFYNDENRETEGVFHFELNPGQVITAFQLDLNGKYRDGSIEEKWKATNAYNTIVGKRIDPALLTMEGSNKYNLRIFPFTAKGTRKVTMTIQQLMKPAKNRVSYSLPLKVENVVSNFKVDISVDDKSLPYTEKGLVESLLFSPRLPGYVLMWEAADIVMKSPISFSIPLTGSSIVCTQTIRDKNHFVVNYDPQTARDYDILPGKAVIYWDISASGIKRNISREISFLKHYIDYHKITEITIFPFNNQVRDTMKFIDPDGSSNWQNYLRNLVYSGSTRLGCIDMNKPDADIYFVFSDGNNSYGKKARADVPLVYAVHAAPNANLKTLYEIVGSGGGSVIDLFKNSMSEAVSSASKARYWLIDIRSAKGKIVSEQELPIPLEEINLINGTMNDLTDTIFLHLGNNGWTTKIEKVVINRNDCKGNAIDRITMLRDFPAKIANYNWENILDFGLREKIVTPNTAYIVLERVEDYIRYNITPPTELEEECNRLNYVKKETRTDRIKQKENERNTMLNNAVLTYNARLKRWNKNERDIQFFASDHHFPGVGGTTSSNSTISTDKTFSADQFIYGTDMMMNEVVVTSLGMSRSRREFGYSVQNIPGQQLSGYLDIEQALQGRVAGVQITSNHSGPGLDNNIRVRGVASLHNNSQALVVIDGIPVEGNINNFISINDIESLTVFRGAQAVTLYGSRAVNGAISIISKKGKVYNNYYDNYYDRKYRLKDMEDEDYLNEIKEVEISKMKNFYELSSALYEDHPGFHFDMAQHFYERGLHDDALEILMNAVELSNGSLQGLRAAGFILESWKKFDMAVEIYQHLVESSPASPFLYRDLAWAHYQDKNYQEAIHVLLRGITNEVIFDPHIKAMMLADMNAIVCLHREQLDISAIPSVLLRPTPVDLRIVIDRNDGYLNNVTITEPDGQKCRDQNTKTKNGGYFNTNLYNYYWYPNPSEYMIKKAIPGKYRIDVHHYDYSMEKNRIPSFVRIMTFRNFGKPDQHITIENVIMDNQSGEIEIGQVKW